MISSNAHDLSEEAGLDPLLTTPMNEPIFSGSGAYDFEPLFTLEELESESPFMCMIVEPFGQTLIAEDFNRNPNNALFRKAFDLMSSGYRYQYERGCWKCTFFYDVYEHHEEGIYIRSVTCDDSLNVLSSCSPTPFARYLKHKQIEHSFVHRLLKAIDDGVTFQNDADDDSDLTSFSTTLLAMLSSGRVKSGNKELDADAKASFEALAESKHSFLGCFRWAMHNYQSFKHAPIFRHFTNLVGIAIAVGFLPEEWTDVHVNSIRIWRLSNQERFHDLFSIADGIIMSLNYFVEATVASWEQGNLLPFLYERTTSVALDEAYEELATLIPRVNDGTYYKEGGAWSDVILKLDNAARLYKHGVESSPPSSLHRKILHDRLLRLNQWSFEMTIARKGGDITTQPFATILHGKPGCGKSGVTLDLQKLQSAINGTPYQACQTASVEPGDAYHSQIYNYTKYIQFDDVANRPLKYDPSLAVAGMLQIVNNKAFVATKAEIELKGRVIPDIQGVYGTTNNRDLHIKALSTEPDSLRRRFYLVDMVVRDQYRNSVGGIDKHKYRADPRVVNFCGEEYPDLQLFTINAAVEGGFEPITRLGPNGVCRLEQLNIAQFYEWMEVLMTEHEAEQKEHVARVNSRSFTRCKDCHFVKCRCCSTMETIPEVSDQDVTHQNALTDAIADAARDSIQKALYDRLCGLWFIGRIAKCFFPGPYVAKLLTRELLDFISSADFTQWWYYVPDELWELWAPFLRKIAPVLKDVKMRKAIYRWQRCHWTCLFCIPVFIIWIAHSGFTYSRAFLLACSIAGSFTASSRILLLHYSAYDAITEKRALMRTMGQREQQNWTPRMKMYHRASKLALNVVVTGLTGYCLYVGYQKLELGNKDDADGEDTTTKDTAEKVDSPKEEAPVSSPPKEDDKPSKSKEVVALEEALARKDAITEKFDTPSDDDGVDDAEKQNFLSVTEEELRRRNDTRNVWLDTNLKYCVGYRNRTMTHDQLHSKIGKNLSAMYKLQKGQWKFCSNILWICTDVCLIAEHDLPLSPERWRIVDNEKRGSGNEVVVTPQDFYSFKGGDIACGHIVHRSKANLVQYINTTPGSLKGYFSHRGSSGKLDDSLPVSGRVVIGRETGVSKIQWTWPEVTYKGACGGVYTSAPGSGDPAILGIHFGCLTENNYIGVSFLPSQAQIRDTMILFHSDESILLGNNPPATWNPTINGRPAFQEVEEPKNSILEQAEWIENNAVEKQGAMYLGHRSVTAYYKSRCVDTIVAEHLRNKHGVPKFGPPRFGRSMWPKSARFALNPSPGVPREHLNWAVRDFLEGFGEIPEYLLEHLRPLNWDETLNGIDGVRFIDAINWTTSMGINYPGGKNAWIVEYLDESGHLRKDFLPEIKAEVKRSLEAFRRGERAPWIFNAVPKDEATPADKEKVRLFQVAEIACVILVRMYYTPICRVMQMLTGRSECAVGLNAVSQDWEDIQQHLERFEKVFDGDYSKYDLRMPAQVTLASCRVMIELASRGSYSGDDLSIMAAIAQEIARPVVIFGGDVVCLDGSTPSGVPITVILNGLDNSLLNRCAYYSIYPNSEPGEFRKYVAHINYGDDFINAVSWWRTKFNFLSMQKYLQDHDIVITPAEKKSEGAPFVDRKGLLFLQRQSTQLPELPYRVGRLKEESIFKPLTCVLRPKSGYDPSLALAVNIDGALREWVYYGEEHYEMRRLEMCELLEEHNIAHMSLVAGKDYHELLYSLQDLSAVPPVDTAE